MAEEDAIYYPARNPAGCNDKAHGMGRNCDDAVAFNRGVR
mgnify:CR=1 FL=1